MVVTSSGCVSTIRSIFGAEPVAKKEKMERYLRIYGHQREIPLATFRS